MDIKDYTEFLVKSIVKNTMENTIKLNVPLVVDISTGTNWYDAK